MKAVAHSYANLETSALEASADFKIKVSDKAFRLLIDGLYSHKIRSIVRELSANAFDSHVRARREAAPFYVHRPTGIRPEFYVRDFGVGMDHEKVMGVYSTLFDSDKDSDNSEVGMYGLGSKSPFAYTDTFAITCYDGNIARHYAASIGTSGVPKIMLFATEASSEPRGVKVSFRVSEKDITEFGREIEAVSLGFNPVFDTNQTLTKKLDKPFLQGKGWASYEEQILPSKWNVRQGCVIYPIKGSPELPLPYDNSRAYLIDAPIGTVEVTVSREEVAYTDRVIEYLNQRVKAVVEEAGDLVAKATAHIETVREFFTQIITIKPAFVEREFRHPGTGLTAPEVALPLYANIFYIYHDPKPSSPHRWSYDHVRKVQAKNGNAPEQFYRVTGIDEIRTDSKPGEPLTTGEYRRVCTRIRNYCESLGDQESEFWFDVPWTDDFVSRLLPGVSFIDLTMEEVRKIKIKRPKANLRGVRKIDQKDWSTLLVQEMAADGVTAWVQAETYRRYKQSIRTLLGSFKIKTFYIVSGRAGCALAKKTGIPTLKEAGEAYLAKHHKVSWDDWRVLANLKTNSLGGAESLYQLMAKLRKSQPHLLKKLLRAKGFLGRLVKTLDLFPDLKFCEIDFQLFKTINYLSNGTEKDGTIVAACPRVKQLEKDLKVIHELRWVHPCHSFMNALNRAQGAEQLEGITNALIAVFHHTPPTMKFKD